MTLLLLGGKNEIRTRLKFRPQMRHQLAMSVGIILVVQSAYGKKIGDYPILVTETLVIPKALDKIIQESNFIIESDSQITIQVINENSKTLGQICNLVTGIIILAKETDHINFFYRNRSPICWQIRLLIEAPCNQLIPIEFSLLCVQKNFFIFTMLTVLNI